MKRFKAQQACLVFMMLILSVFLITGCGGHGGETDKWLGEEGGGPGLPAATCDDQGHPWTWERQLTLACWLARRAELRSPLPIFDIGQR